MQSTSKNSSGGESLTKTLVPARDHGDLDSGTFCWTVLTNWLAISSRSINAGGGDCGFNLECIQYYFEGDRCFDAWCLGPQPDQERRQYRRHFLGSGLRPDRVCLLRVVSRLVRAKDSGHRADGGLGTPHCGPYLLEEQREGRGLPLQGNASPVR